MNRGWNPANGRCRSTGKRIYPTRHEAVQAARHYHGSAYRCDKCGEYHLTHYAPRVAKAIALVMGIRA
jgi:ribosomal protein L32